MKTFFSLFLFVVLMFCRVVLPGQNNALGFDGCGDYITLNPIQGWNTSNASFTVQAWFTSQPDGQACGGNFRRLFAVAGPHRFEVGQCGGDLVIYWFGSSSAGVVTITSPPSINDGLWHCISVRRSTSPQLIEVFLDGVSVYSNTSLVTLNTALFRVGHWGGGATCGQDWLGKVDEVRLWNTALTTAQMMNCDHCVLTGAEPGLMAYWRLDEGVAGLNNIGTTMVNDCTTAGLNDGTLHPSTATPDPGHLLTGTVGNFVAGAPGLLYPQYTKLTLGIEKPGPTPNVNLTEICSGDPIHVCLRDAAGNVPPPGSPFAPVITWECSTDGGVTWPAVPYTNFSTTQFCFNVPPGVVTASNCSASSPGFEDKLFRAKMVVTDPNTSKTCTYYSSIKPLRICCPITTPPIVTLNVQPPIGPLNGSTLCEGDVLTIDVSLTGLPAWLPPTGGSVATIDWEMDDGSGFPVSLVISSPGTSTQFSIPITVGGVTDVCFTANIQNCACPLVTVQTCIKVDKKPICGDIIGCDPALMSVPCPAGSPSDMLCYEICDGDDAAVCLDQASSFMNCIPQWYFSFTNTVGSWVSLGSSNPIQQTNTLPCDDVGSPYEWPAGQQCIYYRVSCNPLSTPSGCEPCSTHVIRVCLKAKPLVPNLVISGLNPVCQGGSSLLNVTNPEPLPITYTWYCNGIVVNGPGSTSTTYPATQEGWYWVVATNVCGESTESNHVQLQVCEVFAAISCPLQPNPCATPGQPIFLTGCNPATFSTCGGALTYAWSVSPTSPPLIINGCNIQHTPPPTGATYTMIVTDSHGCTASATQTVIPCQ